MKLRKKSFLLVASLLLGVTLVMLVVFQFVAMRSFDQMEDDDAIRSVQRVHKLLLEEMADLGRSARDYGTWEELNAAAAAGDGSIVEKDHIYESCVNLQWNLLVLVQTGGRVLSAQETDVAAKRMRPLSPAVEEEMQKIARQFEKGLSDEGAQCFARVGGRVCLVALSPVLSLTRPDSRNGLFIVARYLEESGIERLGRMTDAQVQLVLPPQGWSVSAKSGQGEARQNSRVFVRREHAREVVGCSVLKDWAGQPIGVLEVTINTLIREHGVQFTAILMGVVILGELLILMLIDRLLLRDSISRLADLAAGLSRIHRTGDLATRLPVKGNDEITELVQECNHLLAAVEQTQRTLERVNAEMQQRVSERTAALAEANMALEADIAQRIKAEQESDGLREQLLRAHKMEAVGTLAGGIAHDFNNILAGILGHAQLIAADLAADHPTQRNLNQVVAAAERAASLVRQILAFSRQTPGERRTVSVGLIAREALSLLRAALPSGIAIRCEMQTVADLVNADPTQLHQVFMNLGANSGHAIGSRSGEFIIRIGRVSLGGPLPGATNPLGAGAYVSIEVIDTGCGMSREVVDRIFDPFFSTKPVNEGTGLGLAVVHGIVTDHGGTIQVESEPGKGALFRILLPAAESDSADSGTHHALPLTGTERVLVVDDEEMVLEVISKKLERLGYTVATEATSPGALQRITAAPRDFDLVITDQTMPRMSGLELIAAIKKLRSDLPIILMTGFSPEVTGKDARSLGVAGIVSKPTDIGELTTLMRVALEARR